MMQPKAKKPRVDIKEAWKKDGKEMKKREELERNL